MSDFPPNLTIRPLTIEDLDQCLELEAQGFSEAERCSEENLRYRLTVCPELCSGLFIREYGYKYNAINLRSVAARLAEEHDAKGDDSEDEEDEDHDKLPTKSSVVKEVLVGHIIGTRTKHSTIDEDSMQMPSPDKPNSGHHEGSRNIGVHSVVIHPDWRRQFLATLILHDYIQKLSNQDMGDKIIIIAHQDLIEFYEKIGFEKLGESKCKFANQTWYDLSIALVAGEDSY